MVAIIAANAACITSSAAPCANEANKVWTGAQDKMKHCFCSCEIARTCGIIGSALAGLGKEGWDEIKHQLGKHPMGWDWQDWQDVLADGKGLGCSGSIGVPLIPKLVEWVGATETCECCCKRVVGE